MALITCPECQNKVSDRAATCIYCGCPLENHNSDDLVSQKIETPIILPSHHTHKRKGKFAKKKKKKPFYTRWWFIAPAIIALLGICIFLVPMGGNTQEKQVKQMLEDDLDVSVTIAALYFNEEKQGYFVEFEAGNTSDAAAVHLDTGDIEYKSEFNSYSEKAERLRNEEPINETELHKYNQLIINSSYADWSFAISSMKRNGESESHGWKEINLNELSIDFRKQTVPEDSRSFEEKESADDPTTTVLATQETQEQSEESKNLQSAIEIEKAYTSLLHDMDSRNPSTYIADADYVDGSDYFLELKRDVLELRDELEIYNDLTLIEEKYANIFGQKPIDVEQAKNTTNKLIENLCLETEQGEYFHINLDGILNHIMHYTDYVSFYINQDAGYMVIEQPHLFLAEKNLSEISFSKMLLLMRDFGAEIERKNEKIEIRWSNWERAIGYYYCSNDAQYIKAKEAMENCEYVIEADGFYVEEMELDAVLTINNIPNPDEVECVLIYSLLEDKNGALINGYYNLISELNGNSITIRYTYTGVELDSFEHEYANQTFSYSENFIGAILYKNET